jgi:cyclophilin family peptidyl-prolyl cis-trans isomerase
MLWGICMAFVLHGNAGAQVITTQPQSITVNNASTAEFTVVASNATGFQWEFNGTNLTDGGNISGSSTSTLTLEDVNSNQMGNYAVLINGTLTSSNATLTVTNGTIVTFVFSGLTNGGTNYVDVQLFDHDKPATVQNFLHYISSGAFSNMFVQRDQSGFVIQAGGFAASNRADTNPPITGWSIPNFQPTPPFLLQLDNEFGVGPLIHNRFGTIAMALGASSNSANSQFFFNLEDNSFLDTNDFTVFGRILDETNTLVYFNDLSIDAGIVTNDVFSDNGLLQTNLASLTNLPVNYTGNATPANANLVFCDFLYTNLPVDTIPPTVSITFPAADTVQTNANPMVEGTASDNVSLANISTVLIPQAAGDGTFPNGGVAITNFAIGTSNWLAILGEVVPEENIFGQTTLVTNAVPAGTYQLDVQAQDGAGNLSAVASQPMTNTEVLVIGNGTVTYSNFNAVGYPFQSGPEYDLIATPDTNQVFVSWTQGNLTAFSTNLSLPMNGSILTATFISNSMSDSIAFTYPPPDGMIPTNAFNLTGTITLSNVPSPPVTVVCQIISFTTSETVGPLLTNIGTTNWSMMVSNLPVDGYAVEATAVDQAGNTTVISEDFSVEATGILQVDVTGPGSVSGVTNGEAIVIGSTIQATAIPSNSTDLFYTWEYGNDTGTNVSIGPTFSNNMGSNVTLTATFISNTMPNSITFTAPSSTVILSNGTVQVSGTISNVPAPPATVVCQIFSQTTLLAVTPTVPTIATASNWSVTQSNLLAGSYIAQVLALDQAGNSTVATEYFIATTDTNLPVISIQSPAPNAILPDNQSVIITGTASDSAVPLANVSCFLVPQQASDGTYPNEKVTASVSGVGTSNWSANFGLMPPGVYQVQAEVQDNAGNFGSQTNLLLTNTAILINGNGSVTAMKGTNQIAANPVGYPFQPNVTYQVQAAPGPGQKFVCWSAGANTATDPIQTFDMVEGLLFTANFAPTNAGSGLSFTYPAANARLATNTFLLKGRVSASLGSALVSCRIASLSRGFTVGPLPAVRGPLTWTTTVSNLPPDNYVVVAEATNTAGLSATISERFSLLPCIRAAGTYTGLFITTNIPVSATNSGFLTFTVSPSGVYTGRMVFPAYPAIPIYPLLFENNAFTTGIGTLTLDGFHGEDLAGTIDLDLTGTNDYAVGTISSQNWTAPLVCYRVVKDLSAETTPATGKYIFSIQGGPSNELGTNGYASLTVAKNGTLSLSGVLPDNTTFSESVGVSKEGFWPVCAAPAGDSGKGLILGWEGFTNSNTSVGELVWYKAAGVGPYDLSGLGIFSNLFVTATGTNISLPTPGSAYSMIFEGETIRPPLTNFLTVNQKHQFEVTDGAPDKLRISLSASGVLTGSIFNSNNNRTLQFKGAFISPSQGGTGFLPSLNGEIDSFELVP